jgi:hypothetical protein
MSKFSYSIMTGGGIGECYNCVTRKSPKAAINAWIVGTRRCPTDVAIDSRIDVGDWDFEDDVNAFRAFWTWVGENIDWVRKAEAKAYNSGKWGYVYGYITRTCEAKVAKYAGMSDEELKKAVEYSGYGPFERG